MDAGTAENFIRQNLEIDDFRSGEPADPGRPRLDMLNRIVRSYLHHVPWQNLGLWSLGLQHQPRIPDKQESIKLGLSMQGGMCWSQNAFLEELLKATGFHCSMGIATVTKPMDHAIIFVNDVEEAGDLWLVDGGVGHPTSFAISLDIPDGGATCDFKDSFQTYRYIRNGETFTRQHRIKDGKVPPGRGPAIGEYYNLYFFTLKILKDEALMKCIDKAAYSNLDTMFNKTITMVIWKNNKGIIIKNNWLLFEDEDGGWIKHRLETGDDIIKAVKEHFPAVPESVVTSGVKNWCLQSEAGNTVSPPTGLDNN